MAASVKIEFDDGSRIISQTLEDAAGAIDTRFSGSVLTTGKRPASCSIDDFYEIPRTMAFIADGNFRRVALQFPDALLREAPEVLWTLQARLRKLAAGTRPSPQKSGEESKAVREDEGAVAAGAAGGGAGGGGEAAARATTETTAPPLIFVTGDTSYGSCCVDEVSAQHLKADAIVHYGRACLSPTNSSVPVLYVFGRGELDVADLASFLLSGPLQLHPAPPVAIDTSGGAGGSSNSGPTSVVQDEIPRQSASTTEAGAAGAAAAAGTGTGTGTGMGTGGSGGSPPVLLLYDVTYAYAIPALLQHLADEGFAREGRLAVGLPTPEAYSPLGAGGQSAAGTATASATNQGGGCSCRVTSIPSSLEQLHQISLGTCCGRSCSIKGEQITAAHFPGSSGACCSAGETAATATATATATAGTRTGLAQASLPTTASLGERQQQEEEVKEEEAGEDNQGSSRQKRLVRIGGLGVELESEEDLQRHKLVFVGGEGRQLSNVLMRCAGCADRVRYDPCRPAGQRVVGDTRRGNKDLMRRYYLVQRAREAGVIGIIVGTLGVQRYGSVVRSLRKMVEDAGRKAYTLAVGKINVAKLANFAEVDVFCLVACAENSLLDSKEFHAPVITPLELEVALGKREWNGFYSTDFDDLLSLVKPGGASEAPTSRSAGTQPIIGLHRGTTAAAAGTGNGSEGDGETSDADDEEEEDDDDKPFFSLITGTYQTPPGVPSRRRLGGGAGGGGSGEGVIDGGSGKDAESAGGALVGIGDRSLVEWSSPAADFLDKRKFKGLEALVGQTEAKPATEGQSGIASDYGGV